VESRFEAMHATGLTALVGREEETELLLRRWARANTSEGQVVLIAGEAGIGKSRLTAALMESLGGEPHTRLRHFCSPQHTDSPLYPIINQMERAAGLEHNDAPRARLDKLDAVLAQTATSVEDAALFADMLSLPNDGRYLAVDLTPEERRQRTLEALTARLVGLASLQPVLMIFEDVHWIDPTSLEALGRTVDRIKTLPALLIVTFRSEFNAPWVGQPHVTSLTLNRLGEREAASIIAALVGNKGLPADVIAEIVERTDGIPLFVEEMTKAVLEAESEGAALRTVGAVPSPALAVPASLHASLMARLDRLGPAKEVAQIGAAMGREFSHALLASVVPKPDAELESALDRLIAVGLLFRQGVPPHATYLFKHVLVQDAAYGTLLREPRRALHARIAEVLESQFAEIVESRPELLARHCTEAGLSEKAAALWGKAGRRSLERSAMVEAAERLTRAITQIATLPSTPALRHEQIKLQVALTMDWLRPFMTPRQYRRGEVLFHKGDAAKEMFLTVTGRFLVAEIDVEIPSGRIMGELGFLAPKNLGRTFTVKCIEDGDVLIVTYERLIELYFQNPEFGLYFLRVIVENRARLSIEQAEALGEGPQDPLLLFSVLYRFWVANLNAFNCDRVRKLAAQFLALAEKQSATITLMVAHRLMGSFLMHTGEIGEGRAHLDQAVALYDAAEPRRLATQFGADARAIALSYRSMTLWLLGYPEAAHADTEHAIKDAREVGQAASLVHALGHCTLTHFWSGNYAAANTFTEELLALADKMGLQQRKTFGMMNQGCVLALTGKCSDAIQLITSGITAWQSAESTLWTPMYLSRLARAHAELGQFDDARRRIGEALTAVETHKERIWEAEVHRIAGDITLMAPEPDEQKAEAYFERALATARKQQAKSWELRAAMSMARLWRDQGERQRAHDLLAPIYGWFTESFDTMDLKEAKALLEQLKA
jgi:predicted ATPase